MTKQKIGHFVKVTLEEIILKKYKQIIESFSKILSSIKAAVGETPPILFHGKAKHQIIKQ